MSERVMLAQLILPPSADFCMSGLCGQNACCTLEVRVEASERDDPEDEEVYVLPLCAAHVLWTMTGILSYAQGLFPPTEVDLPPWERDK